MKRCFIFKDEKSQKYWNIEAEDCRLKIVYGRLGTAGQASEKEFESAEKCIAEAEKQIAGKMKKGYTEVTEDQVADAKDESKRIGYTWDGWEEGKTNEDLINQLLKYKHLADVKNLTVANWQGAFECDGCQQVLDKLVEKKDQLQNIEFLRIGDMDQEECEISWIEQGDYTKLLEAFPNLKHLVIQGANELSLGNIHHQKLESIEVICGGLSGQVIRQVAGAEAPHLKKFNLYMGVDNYGFDGSLEDVDGLINKSQFPELNYLGICNMETKFADQVAEAVARCKYAGQIETLDLSKSVVTDQGARALVDCAENFKSLKLLDLGYHYITAELMDALKKLPFKVDLSDPQTYDDEEDYYNDPMFTE